MSKFATILTAAILTAVVVAFAVTGCGKQSEAEKQELDRQALREKKLDLAIQYYKTIAEKFPETPHAAEATKKAKELEATKPKK